MDKEHECRDKALEEAAKVCEQMQNEKDALFDERLGGNGWKTLGSTEISGHSFAFNIRAIKNGKGKP